MHAPVNPLALRESTTLPMVYQRSDTEWPHGRDVVDVATEN